MVNYQEDFQYFHSKLESMKGLKQGWDSYSGAPPSQLAIDNAGAFLDCMSTSYVLPNRVSAAAVGGVAITVRSPNYKTDRKKTYFEFHNSGRAFMMNAEDTVDGDIDIKEVQHVTEYYVKAIESCIKYLDLQIPTN